MNGFGERLQKLRKEKKMSQNDLAKFMEVSRPTISQWEAETKKPSTSSLTKLSLFFDVSVDYLMGNTTFSEEQQQVVDKIKSDVPLDQIAKDHDISINGKIMTQKQKELLLMFAKTMIHEE